ncbi:hypothetical protein IWQ56_001000 [Coemansia nantahalensis]|uniref:Uncharacterized protein n=1 Tax=Coemansia nantahalensis TaxID=2789366 RepID=A0ACC1K4D6_9FUNG|nr:hypothetical protein IWQ57_001492 [Coemansia nantahalensis]KAJ2773420.1 hypothetical protein IWQ56_001000 [Coemansia nantahalensis]
MTGDSAYSYVKVPAAVATWAKGMLTRVCDLSTGHTLVYWQLHAFVAFVLLQELAEAFEKLRGGSPFVLSIDVGELLTGSGLRKIYQLLSAPTRKPGKGEKPEQGVIRRYLDDFLECIPFRGVSLPCPSVIGQGAGTRVATEYGNVVKANMSDLLHTLIRLTLDVPGRTAERMQKFIEQERAKGVSEDKIRMAVESVARAADTAAARQSAAAIRKILIEAGEEVPTDVDAEDVLDAEHALTDDIRKNIVEPAKVLYSLVRLGISDLDAVRKRSNKGAAGEHGDTDAAGERADTDAAGACDDKGAAKKRGGKGAARKRGSKGAGRKRGGKGLASEVTEEDVDKLTEHERNIYHTVLQPILKTYGDNYTFQKSLYYAAMVRPQKHFVALYVTARMLAERGINIPQLTPMASCQTKHVDFTKRVITGCLLNKVEREVLDRYKEAVKAEQAVTAAAAEAARAILCQPGALQGDISALAQAAARTTRAVVAAKVAAARAANAALAAAREHGVAYNWLQEPGKINPELLPLSMVLNPASICRLRRPGRELHCWGCLSTEGVSISLQFSTQEARNEATCQPKKQPGAADASPASSNASPTTSNAVPTTSNAVPAVPAPAAPADTADADAGLDTSDIPPETEHDKCMLSADDDNLPPQFVRIAPAADADAAQAILTRDGFEYVGPAHRELLNKYINYTIFIDPGRRDILYIVDTEGRVMRYTSCEHERIVKVLRHHAIREEVLHQHPEISAALDELSKHSFHTLDVNAFKCALRAWGRHILPLIKYYGHAGPRTLNMCNSGRAAAPSATSDSNEPFPTQPQSTPAGAPAHVAADDMVGDSDSDSDEPLLEWLERTRPAVPSILTGDLAMLRADCDAHGSPLHMKLRLDSFINHQKADSYLADKIMATFGNGTGDKPLVICGDWSGGNAKHHIPLRRSKAFCQALAGQGFHVLLADEFRTSMLHWECGSVLVPARTISSPRPPRNARSKPADSTAPPADSGPKPFNCHGQYICTNQACWERIEARRAANTQNRQERALKRKQQGLAPEKLQVPPKSQQPKHVKKGFTMRPVSSWERKRMPHRFGRVKYRRVGRARTHDMAMIPVGGYVTFVHRDFNACQNIRIKVESYAKGEELPKRFLRSTKIDKSNKRKGGAGAATIIETPPKCRECLQKDHGHGTCPPVSDSAADSQVESSKRRRT